MAKLVLTMTMSLDGFFSGPDGELDWMTRAADPEFSRDNVAFFDHIDRGFIGYPTASGMLPYWMNVASDPQAPADQPALAEALNNLRPILISRREEPVPWPNAELLIARDDEQLADAVRKEKAKPGKASVSPAASALPRPSSASGWSTSTSSPCTPSGSVVGRRVFTGKTGLELIDAKAYQSGVTRARYRETAGGRQS
ncbi:MAG TPA: hypothetical protein VMG38_18440 [Trebonia sp.]|nr:hypothetical protein [Trebonia sp.]